MERTAIDDPGDLRFSRRSWIFERAGWAGLAAVVAAGLAGVLGPGPLSRARADGGADAPRVRFDRFVHRQTETRLDVRVPRGLAQDGLVRVWIDRSWHDAVAVVGVQPVPASVQVEPDRLVYAFAAGGGDEALALAFDVEFERPGRRKGRFGAVGGGASKVSQIVYP